MHHRSTAQANSNSNKASSGGGGGGGAAVPATVGDGAKSAEPPAGSPVGSASEHQAWFRPTLIIEFAEDSPSFRQKVEALDRNVEGENIRFAVIISGTAIIARPWSNCWHGPNTVQWGTTVFCILSPVQNILCFTSWSTCLRCCCCFCYWSIE